MYCLKIAVAAPKPFQGKLYDSYWGWNDLSCQTAHLNVFYKAEAKETQAIIDRLIKSLPPQLKIGIKDSPTPIG
jgi:hypothetical protein